MLDRRGTLLIAGDVVVLIAFGLAGLASHEREFTAAPLARSLLPFLVTWLVVGGLLGVFRPSLYDDFGGYWPRLVAVWLLCGVIALTARSIIFDRPLFTAFFVIGLLGNGLALVTWRAVFDALGRRTRLSS